MNGNTGFDANDMCCRCGGGECEHKNNGAFDSLGNLCGWYDTRGLRCGENDDDDFIASEMCCACLGLYTPVSKAGLTCFNSNEA